MKRLFVASLSLHLVLSGAHSGEAPVILDRGPDHRTWATAVQFTAPDGTIQTRTSKVTELVSGMHYRQGNEWVESQELIEPMPGGAKASRGRHKVSFALNLNTLGAIEFAPDDGAVLRSHVLALAYTDTQAGQRVFFASIKDAQGEIQLPNRVLYRDAFDGAKADVRYTWTRNGFEQDVIFRESPVSPADLGLNPETTKLEVFTEFVDGNNPQKRIKPLRNVPDAALQRGVGFPVTTDTLVDFPGARFGRGHALMAGDAIHGTQKVPVGKAWETLENRTFLIEAVNFRTVKPQLETLPQQAALAPNERVKMLAAKLPQKPKLVADIPSKPMQMASAKGDQLGLVVDYAILGSARTNFTFTNGITYWIGSVDLIGTTTFEGGAVLKYSSGGYLNQWDGRVVTDNSLFDPVFFTSVNDNSVGETITGSTGSPQAEPSLTAYLFVNDGVTDLRNVKINYACYGLYYINATNMLVNAQFTHCFSPAYMELGSSPFRWMNVLATDCDALVGGGTDVGSIEHLTASKIRTLVDNGGGSPVAVALTNTLLLNVTNLGNATVSSNGLVRLSGAATNIFAAVGAGRHYLNDPSVYRDAGTTNISAIVAKSVREGTTYAPVVTVSNTVSISTVWSQQVQRDTDTPDIGYHYPPLDYASFVTRVTNATLRITAGTTVGMFGYSALWITDRGTLICDGQPDRRIQLRHYSAFQEEPGGWISPGWGSLFIHPYHWTTNAPSIRFRFVDHKAFWNGYGVYMGSTSFSMEPLDVSHSSIDGGAWLVNAGTLRLTNNYISCFGEMAIEYASEVYVINNLIHRVPFGDFLRDPSGTPWVFKNNFVCDSTIFNVDDTLVHTHNAFYNSTNSDGFTNATEFVLTNHTFQVGPLGKFYIPTNSALTNAGSTWATNVGLYHFTTMTNQMKEAGSQVDIGLHYVSTDSLGSPSDADYDGEHDYREDSNGNGIYDTGTFESDWQTYNSPYSLSTPPALKVYTPLEK